MRDLLRNSAVLILSTAVAITAAEIVVRLFVPVRDVGPVFSMHDPVLGKRLKPNLAAERITPEFRMRLTTNSLGFRGAEPDGRGVRPILFLGDSFTLGYGVSDGEEYPARVAVALRSQFGHSAPPVVNAGIGNSGNGFWLKLLRRDALAMRPRLVVMQVSDNDFADNLEEKLFAVDAQQRLRELPVPPPGAVRRLEAVIQAVPGLPYSHLVGLLRQVRPPTFATVAAGTAPERQDSGGGAQLTLRILEEAIARCDKEQWAMLAVLVGLSPEHESAVKELFAGYAVPVVRIPAKNERPQLYYQIDGHWHAAGHAFAAERIMEALQAHSLVPSARQGESY